MVKKIENRGAYLKNKSIEDVSERQSLVANILEGFKEQKLKFNGISHISLAVSKAMQKENSSISVSDKSLLKKKSAYRNMLEAYLGNSFSIKSREQELQQLLMLEQLETKRLQKKINTLTNELSSLSEKHYQLEDSGLHNRTHGSIEQVNTKDYDILFRVMHMLAGDFISVDSDGAFDTSEVPKKCVLKRSEYPEFFEWLENKGT